MTTLVLVKQRRPALWPPQLSIEDGIQVRTGQKTPRMLSLHGFARNVPTCQCNPCHSLVDVRCERAGRGLSVD